jgi:hypothetical protein
MKSGEKAALAGITLLGALLLMSSGKKSPVSQLPLPFLTDDYRRSLLEVALGEVGLSGGDKYWQEVNPTFVGSHQDWCGGFVLWCLHQVGLATDRRWIMSRGFILTPPFALQTTNDPQPGDIVYIDQPNQHQALLLSINGQSIQTIDGNSTGGRVAIGNRAKSSAVYYSIEPLIQQALQQRSNA